MATMVVVAATTATMKITTTAATTMKTATSPTTTTMTTTTTTIDNDGNGKGGNSNGDGDGNSDDDEMTSTTTATTMTTKTVTSPTTTTATMGKDIYNQRCEALDNKALTNGFNMMPNKTIVFIKALERKADSMSWSTGTKQITKFTNQDGVDIDIIKNYGQIDMATLKTVCEQFCKAGEADSET